MTALLAAIIVALALSAAPVSAQEAADLVVTGGVIHTADPDAPLAQAMAVSDGIIVAIGSADEIERYRGPGTTSIELEGRAVIPGLIDAHAHVFNLGMFLRTVDLVGTTAIEEIATRVREAAAGRPAGEWILGRGWDQNDWAVEEFPTAAAFDAAAPHHPVWLTRVDGHAGWANRRAMELAGITAETPDPEGGRIVRDQAGNPTGVFIDNAEDLIEAAIPAPGPEELRARLAAAEERMVSVGLTGVHDMGTEAEEVEVLQDWAEAGRLVPRIVSYLDSSDTTLMSALDSIAAAASPEPGDRFRIRGVKFYADGALGSRGAALLEPYSDDPGNVGLLVTPPELLEAGVTRAVGLGLQPAIHAIGDRGNRVALEAIRAAESVNMATARDADGGSTTRDERAAIAPRIEHAQVVALEDIPRFAELGVVASMQPTHATSDMPWAEERVGPARIRGAYAWRTLLTAGARIVAGSDFPVEEPSPLLGVYAAVTRQDGKGMPTLGWYPEQRMTLDEAIRAFTAEPAYAVFDEASRGRLAPGMKADLTVFARPLEAGPRLLEQTIAMTIVEGKPIYEARE